MALAAIVLAAGRASRFGADKLLADFRGEPLVTHALRAAMALAEGLSGDEGLGRPLRGRADVDTPTDLGALTEHL